MAASVNDQLKKISVTHAVNLAHVELEIAEIAARIFRDRLTVSTRSDLSRSVQEAWSATLKRLHALLINAIAVISLRQSIELTAVMSRSFQEEKSAISFVPLLPMTQRDAEKLMTQLSKPDSWAAERSIFASADRQQKLGAETVGKARSIFERELAHGSTPHEIATTLEDSLGSVTRWQRVVRNEVQRVNSATLDRGFDKNKESLLGLEYLATLDDRTCPICAAYDGQIYYYEPEEGQLSIDDRPETPVHDYCRCTYTPVVHGLEVLQDRGFVTGGGEEESEFLSGQLSRRLTYDDWLRDQPEETQQQLLGDTKWKLFNQGMSVNKFVVNGEPLSLDRLANLKVGQVGVRKPRTLPAKSQDISRSATIMSAKGLPIDLSNEYVTTMLGSEGSVKVTTLHSELTDRTTGVIKHRAKIRSSEGSTTERVTSVAWPSKASFETAVEKLLRSNPEQLITSQRFKGSQRLVARFNRDPRTKDVKVGFFRGGPGETIFVNPTTAENLLKGTYEA